MEDKGTLLNMLPSASLKESHNSVYMNVGAVLPILQKMGLSAHRESFAGVPTFPPRNKAGQPRVTAAG